MEKSQMDLLIQEKWDNVAHQYMMLAAFVLIFYDTLLTSPQEVKYIWRRKRRFGSITYVIARYSALVYFFLAVLFDFRPVVPLKTCSTFVYSSTFPYILKEASVQVLLLGRVFAICKNQRWIGAIPLIGTLGFIATALAEAAASSETCAYADGAKIYVSIKNVFLILLDGTVFIIMASHIWSNYRLQSMVTRSTSGSLLFLLLKQGVIRFGIMLVWGIEGIVSEKLLRGRIAGVDCRVESVMGTILVCHFHLDLIKRHGNVERETDGSSPSPSSLTNILHRIGQSIVEEFDEHNIPFSHSPDEEQPAELAKNDVKAPCDLSWGVGYRRERV